MKYFCRKEWRIHCTHEFITNVENSNVYSMNGNETFRQSLTTGEEKMVETDALSSSQNSVHVPGLSLSQDNPSEEK